MMTFGILHGLILPYSDSLTDFVGGIFRIQE